MRHGDYTHDQQRLAAIAAQQPAPTVAGNRLLLAGDCHGDFNFLGWLIACARRHSIDTIVQVGDFGYWPHQADYNRSLRRHARQLVREGITVIFCDGNHENFEALWQPRPLAAGTPFQVVEPNVLYAPRGARWQAGGREIVFLGGATSIDKDWRRAEERKRKKSQTSRWFWWQEEAIREEDAQLAIAGGPADILICHDAPSSSNLRSYAPELKGYKADPPTELNRQLLQQVVNALRPELVVHGHWHVRYSGECGGFDWSARCEGLGDNTGKRERSVAVLDLATLELSAA
jgi:Icc-related predicted phosphoesterase